MAIAGRPWFGQRSHRRGAYALGHVDVDADLALPKQLVEPQHCRCGQAHLLNAHIHPEPRCAIRRDARRGKPQRREGTHAHNEVAENGAALCHHGQSLAAGLVLLAVELLEVDVSSAELRAVLLVVTALVSIMRVLGRFGRPDDKIHVAVLLLF